MRLVLAAAAGVLALGSTGCPPKPVGGGCEWEQWEGTCELLDIDDPDPPNSSGNVIVRAHYRITPAPGSGTPPDSFTHAEYATPDQVEGLVDHLEAHRSVHCASATLVRGSCGPWDPTFELPPYEPTAP